MLFDIIIIDNIFGHNVWILKSAIKWMTFETQQSSRW